MKSLQEQIAELRSLGYATDTARAKVAHDIILLAMHRSGFKPNSTIKGGVVMSSLTGDVRRATMDMDIDFLHYSLAKASVERFVRKLARAMPEVSLSIVGPIVELKHEDYRGKRIYLAVKDASLMRAIRTKMDIGVHTREEMKQVDFSFDVVSDAENADLFANSREQIFAEKLVSLLRHGAATGRVKDIFDMYYLSQNLNRPLLKRYVKAIIFDSRRCKVSNRDDLIKVIKQIFGLRMFVRKLNNTRVNWIGEDPTVVLNALIEFVSSL